MCELDFASVTEASYLGTEVLTYLRDCPHHMVCRPWSVFLIIIGVGGTQLIVSSTTPGMVILGCIRKQIDGSGSTCTQEIEAGESPISRIYSIQPVL